MTSLKRKAVCSIHAEPTHFSYRPTERLLDQWRLLDLDLAPGNVAGGLERLEPLFQPLYEALLARYAESAFAQANTKPAGWSSSTWKARRGIGGGYGSS